jgi:serine/threonine protein kinase
MFGPYPPKYLELVEGDQRIQITLLYLHENIPKYEWSQLWRVSEKEMSRNDRAFLERVMTMDPRDRPTAKELLQDPWFDVEEPSNRFQK